ncbi:hypothetical protein Avbf_14677 [Armadillidium vulgare]|nr:hypothetical protein Avbf_14677 [Armadillidium vulgare]
MKSFYIENRYINMFQDLKSEIPINENKPSIEKFTNFFMSNKYQQYQYNYLKLKMVNKSKFTQEEELLLQDFSRNVTKKSSLIFYVNAFLVSVIPVCKFYFLFWLFCRIHMMELLSSAILILIVTGVSTYLLSFAYKNTKFILKHKIAQKVEEAVTKEVMKKLSDNKRMSKKEKEER